jgi:hypothetical protein
MYLANYGRSGTDNDGKWQTHSFVIEPAESIKYFGDNRHPCHNIFALRICTQFVVVLQNTKSQPEQQLRG